MSGWTLIDSLDAPSGGAFTFSSLTLTSYPIVHIVCSGITVTTDGTDPLLTFYVGGVEQTSGYRWALQGAEASPTTITDGAGSATSINLVSDNANWDTGNASTESFGCLIRLDEPTNTSLYKRAAFKTALVLASGLVSVVVGMGLMENAGAINGLKISGTSSLTAGKVRILGLT